MRMTSALTCTRIDPGSGCQLRMCRTTALLFEWGLPISDRTRWIESTKKEDCVERPFLTPYITPCEANACPLDHAKAITPQPTRRQRSLVVKCN